MRRAAAVLVCVLALGAAADRAAAATSVALAPLPATQTVDAARVAAVADRIVHQLVTDPDRVILPAFKLVDQKVPSGDVELIAGAPQVNPTYVAVPVRISVDGKLATTVFAGYRIAQYVRTATAARDLQPGTVLGAGDVQIVRVLSNGRPAVEASALLGRRLRAATSHGALLFPEQTSAVALVRAGSGVVLIVRDGPVMLTADVIARNDGGLGDTIAVFNPQTNKVISGTVIGQNQVELTLPGGESQ